MMRGHILSAAVAALVLVAGASAQQTPVRDNRPKPADPVAAGPTGTDPAFLAALVPAAVPISLAPGEKKAQDLIVK